LLDTDVEIEDVIARPKDVPNCKREISKGKEGKVLHAYTSDHVEYPPG
jgi:serine/threonine-protein kinase RIO1